MKWITRFYNSLNLQNKLRFCFILLILLPSLIIAVAYYGISSKSIIDTAKKNILDVVDKNTQIIDRQLQYAQTSAVNLNVDEDLFSILNGIAEVSDYELMMKDSHVRGLMNKYFPEEHLVSANIMTKTYVLGSNAEMVIPPEVFYQSRFYQQIRELKGAPQWIPAYGVSETFNLNYSQPHSQVFSLVQVLTPIVIDNSSSTVVKQLPESAGDCVLMVSFQDDLFREMFDNSVSVKGAFYCISSQEGEIVSHTDPGQIGRQEQLPWLTEIGRRGSGSTIQTFHGEQMLVCYSVSDVTGWVFSSVTPVSGLLNNVSKLRIVTLIMGVVLLLMAMFLSAIFSRRITQPVGRLVEALRQVGKGNFSLRLPTSGNDELQYLTEKYNEMGAQIQTLIAENYESEIRKKESEIMALNLQLNPHFLYNTLNIINMMALESGETDISKMIVCLSDMLQYTFKNKQELVRFEEEYLWLQNYIYIMSSRFEGKFTVQYQVDRELSGFRVPKLLLQPLVENAIAHGFRNVKRGGILSIRGWKTEDALFLEVEDNGQGMDERQMEQAKQADYNRIGLSNTIRRLQLIYGNDGDIQLKSHPGEGTKITISFPLES